MNSPLRLILISSFLKCIVLVSVFTCDAGQLPVNPDTIVYDDRAFADNIKTVLLFKDGHELSVPVIELNTNEKLRLLFDDLEGGTKDYSYTFIHCDAKWNASDLIPAQYINGYTDDRITGYLFSFNTIQKYTHYSLQFPTENMMPILPGNYVIKVFSGYDPEKVVLTRRFMVVQPKIHIEATVRKATIVSDSRTKQEIDFTIFHDNYSILNPNGELTVVLTQNGRWDHAIPNLKPMFIRGSELIYDYDNGNTFNGGKEFRYFDTRSLRTQSERTRNMLYDSTGYHVFLMSDEKRAHQRYTYDPDINGKFSIRVQENRDGSTEADYVWVHFRIPWDTPLQGGNFYVYGSFCDWRANDLTKMKYNASTAAYEVSVYLKQGYFNYEYVFADDWSKQADETIVEGSHYETENEYAIYIYHRPFGSRYDQLIGTWWGNSVKRY